MDAPVIWFLKLVSAHLLTDFLLQPTGWIKKRNEKHFGSGYLYLHGLITAGVVCLFIGYTYWIVIGVILLSHIMIDGWKSYRRQNLTYFLADQLLHFAVLIGCFFFTFPDTFDIIGFWSRLSNNHRFWKLGVAVIFLTLPAGILIGLITKQWSEKIRDTNLDSLSNAGKWIGIAERMIVLILVIHHQYEAIGLLVAAKSILRFNEKNRPEIKTEYLLIGTLLSIGLAIITGELVR
jgi:hypothetical protein